MLFHFLHLTTKCIPYSFISHYTSKSFFSLILSILACLCILLQLFKIFWTIILISLCSPFCHIPPSPILYNTSHKLAAQLSCFKFPIASHNNITSTVRLVPPVRLYTRISLLYRTSSFFSLPPQLMFYRAIYCTLLWPQDCLPKSPLHIIYSCPSSFNHPYFNPTNHFWQTGNILYIFWHYCCQILLWLSILLPLFQHFVTGSGVLR